MTAADAPVIVLGAGYAGVRVAHELSRRAGGRMPVQLVDRHPIHVVRTELYQVGELAAVGSDVRKWAIPIDRVVGRRNVSYREGNLESIDLAGRSVRLGGESLSYGSLAICLGNVPSYYGVPGAVDRMHQVYGLLGAMRLARAMRELEAASSELPTGTRPQVVVVGGGSTGTEVAAEIATTDWRRLVGPLARPPQVTLVCGALPFLSGLDPRLVEHARRLLFESGVLVDEGKNVQEVEEGMLRLEGGVRLPFDLGVWAAGIEAPPPVRSLPVPHGKGGRIAVDPTLEVPGQRGVFAVGDVVELRDARTGALVPATARAALSEAPVAARNLLARREGRPLEPFEFRERGTIVALGEGRAAGKLNRVTVWGSPAALLKALAEQEYRLISEHAPGLSR